MVELHCADCLEWLERAEGEEFDLTFFDPPFNQGKEYRFFDDSLPHDEYWDWMKQILERIYEFTSDGGAIYFMQREKNTEQVLRILKEPGWSLQNAVIWKKMTSAVPSTNKFGKHYQIIAFATKGKSPRVFHKLRVSPPLPPNYRFERENGIFVMDIWDDIRELTSGYFAGDEAIRDKNNERFHKQQSPIVLLLRIVLSSSKPGDTIFDPFAGTGTTLVVANQLQRRSVGIEIDPENIKCIQQRLTSLRDADDSERFRKDYICTEDINHIWGSVLDNDRDEGEWERLLSEVS